MNTTRRCMVVAIVMLAPLGARAQSQQTKEGKSALPSARVAPAGPHQAGIRLVSLRPDEMIARMGLREGDVVKRIDGTDVNEPADLMEVYIFSRAGRSRPRAVTIEILRDSAPMTLRYELEGPFLRAPNGAWIRVADASEAEMKRIFERLRKERDRSSPVILPWEDVAARLREMNPELSEQQIQEMQIKMKRIMSQAPRGSGSPESRTVRDNPN